MMAGTETFQPFHMDHYRTPVADDVFYKIRVGDHMNKEKRTNFSDAEAKRLKYVPGPPEYI